MSVWRVRESRELGKEGRVWSLGEKGLTVGRSSDCDIQLLSQSVENKHAVLEWSQKKESYVIRDLASVNGTYINMLPLRNGIAVLKHGDIIRFGYEKGHLFRLEEVATAPPPSPPPPQHPITSTATATQTSPAEDPPPHKAVPLPSQAVPPPSQAVPPSTMAMQYMPVHSQPHTIIIPAVQQALPYIMPQPMAYGYPPPLASPMHPHQLMQTPQHPGMVLQPISPTPFIQPAPPTPATHSHMTVEDIESESAGQGAGSPSPRRDGRRPVSAINTPSLTKASPLYGQPAWWGEEVRASASDSELGCSRPGSVILRDLDFEAVKASTGKSQQHHSSAAQSSSSTVEDLRKQAISNRASEHDMTTSWTVGFDSAGHGKKPPNINRPRPHRPRAASPASARARSLSPSRRSPGFSPQSGPAPHRRSLAGGTSRKPPSLSSRKPPTGIKRTARRSTPILGKGSKTPAKETSEIPAPATREHVTAPCQPSSPADVHHNLTYTTTSHLSSGESHSHTTASDLSMSSVSDQPPISSSPVLPTPPPLKCPSEAQIGQKGDATFVVAEGDRPGSARKQWGSDQSQPPTSLMLASIEARMRRLSRMAQNTLLSVRETLGLDVKGEGVSEPPPSPTPPSSSQVLPEWKFFNKEVDNIFRNIRSVERYLGELGSVVTVGQEGGSAKKEEVDYDGDSESEDTEPFPDSMEDVQWTATPSSSDTEEPT